MGVSNLNDIRDAKSDMELAKELERELRDSLEKPMQILQKARAAGLNLEWGIGVDNFGRYSINKISIVRPLV